MKRLICILILVCFVAGKPIACSPIDEKDIYTGFPVNQGDGAIIYAQTVGQASNCIVDEGEDTQSIHIRKKKKKKKARWIFYGSQTKGKLTKEQKQKVDSMVKKWTNGKLSDDELLEKLISYLEDDLGLETGDAGIMSNSKCIFDSMDDIPNYKKILKKRRGIYNFIGLYTKGKKTKSGDLICYYWEAGVM